ncbi:MAG TPA: hypothetical protein VGG25_24475 [Streptosporangiaceae bacterium]
MTTTDSSVIDTGQGTVQLILGGGGTSAPLDSYGTDPGDGLRQAKVFTRRNAPAPDSAAGTYTRPAADAVAAASQARLPPARPSTRASPWCGGTATVSTATVSTATGSQARRTNPPHA